MSLPCVPCVLYVPSDACAVGALVRRVAAVAAPAVRRVRRVAFVAVGVFSGAGIALSFARSPSTISALIDARPHTLVAPP
jgi:hypothetical protein